MAYNNGRPGLYRSRQGLLFGVCRGAADYLDISVFWTRMLTLLLMVFTGFWPVTIIYLLAALVLKREPGAWATPYHEHWRYAQYEAARACRRAADSLDARLERMEHAAARDMRDWEARLNTE